MPVAIRQIHPVFVGEVSGVDIKGPLSREAIAAIEAGMDRYAVLVFRDQAVSDDEQMAFTRNFGAIENARGGNVTKEEDKRLATGMNDVSNLGKDGRPLARDSRQRLFNLGNLLWHSDSSFRAIPAKYSLLSARVVNPKGGDTEFADMRAAYDALDRGQQGRNREPGVRALVDVFARRPSASSTTPRRRSSSSSLYASAWCARTPSAAASPFIFPPMPAAIIGKPTPEARILLNDLREHATQSRFVYVHKWKVNDLVMWDNRQTMHRGRRYDESQARDVRRTTVAGDAPTIAQAAAE